MANTTYIDNVTVITADTMNDLNRLHYTILGDPADAAAVRTALGVISGTGGTWIPTFSYADVTVTPPVLSDYSFSYAKAGSIVVLSCSFLIFSGDEGAGSGRLTFSLPPGLNASGAGGGHLALYGGNAAITGPVIAETSGAGVTLAYRNASGGVTDISASNLMGGGGSVTLRGSLVYLV